MSSLSEIFSDLLRSKNIRLLFWVLFCLFCLILVLDVILLPWYVNRRSTLTVPNVVGLKKDAAFRTLDSLHLEPREGETRPDKEYPLDVVVAQNPAPSQIVKQGRRIYLTISGGEQLVVVPQLKGRSLRDTKFALERFGLKLGVIIPEKSDEFPEGTIISQEIPTGARVKRGTSIRINVSSGINVDSIVVPNLIGKTMIDAQKILLDKGLRVGKVSYQINGEFLPNTILDQFPRANEIVNSIVVIDLFIAQVPDKKGKQREN